MLAMPNIMANPGAVKSSGSRKGGGSGTKLSPPVVTGSRYTFHVSPASRLRDCQSSNFFDRSTA